MSELTGIVLYGCWRRRSICEGEDWLVDYYMILQDTLFQSTLLVSVVVLQ